MVPHWNVDHNSRTVNDIVRAEDLRIGRLCGVMGFSLALFIFLVGVLVG